LTTYMFLPLLFFAGFWGGSAHNSKRDHISVPVEDGMDLLVLVYRDHQWTQKKYLLYFHRPVLRVAFERGTCHFQVRGSWNSGNPHEFMLGQNPVIRAVELGEVDLLVRCRMDALIEQRMGDFRIRGRRRGRLQPIRCRSGDGHSDLLPCIPIDGYGEGAVPGTAIVGVGVEKGVRGAVVDLADSPGDACDR